jgi:hypothetical protein
MPLINIKRTTIHATIKDTTSCQTSFPGSSMLPPSCKTTFLK